VFDKLAHDTDCSRLIFDLDGDLTAHDVASPKWGQAAVSQSEKLGMLIFDCANLAAVNR
jgi:hypothetical protein